MKGARQNGKPICIFLTFLMLSITVPFQSVLAAMIGTEAALDSIRSRQARDQINNLLLRKDIQSILRAEGIDPLEANARVDSLSDAEVVQLADQIDEIPAGGTLQIIPTWVVILILVALGLLIYLFFSAVTPPAEIEK